MQHFQCLHLLQSPVGSGSAGIHSVYMGQGLQSLCRRTGYLIVTHPSTVVSPVQPGGTRFFHSSMQGFSFGIWILPSSKTNAGEWLESFISFVVTFLNAVQGKLKNSRNKTETLWSHVSLSMNGVWYSWECVRLTQLLYGNNHRIAFS